MAAAPRSILIVRLSALGDVVHTLPCLSALRRAFPDAKLGWAVEELSAPLLEGHPELDRLHVIPRKSWARELKRGAVAKVWGEARRKLRELRVERYEVALDFQSNFRSASVARLSGAARRIGQPAPFAKEGSRWLFTETPASVANDAHKIERNLSLLAPLGIAAPPSRGVIPSREEAAPAPGIPARSERRRVVIHPGVSSFGAIKAWRPERFLELATRLVAEDCDVLLSWGGRSERLQAEHLVRQASGVRLAPETDVAGLVALLHSADLFVGVDSGPLHLAAMLGTPALGLYGPKQVSIYGPWWPETKTLAADYPCSPCRYRRCPQPEVKTVQLADGSCAPFSPCMDTISVDDAFDAAVALLDGPR